MWSILLLLTCTLPPEPTTPKPPAGAPPPPEEGPCTCPMCQGDWAPKRDPEDPEDPEDPPPAPPPPPPPEPCRGYTSPHEDPLKPWIEFPPAGKPGKAVLRVPMGDLTGQQASA